MAAGVAGPGKRVASPLHVDSSTVVVGIGEGRGSGWVDWWLQEGDAFYGEGAPRAFGSWKFLRRCLGAGRLQVTSRAVAAPPHQPTNFQVANATAAFRKESAMNICVEKQKRVR